MYLHIFIFSILIGSSLFSCTPPDIVNLGAAKSLEESDEFPGKVRVKTIATVTTSTSTANKPKPLIAKQNSSDACDDNRKRHNDLNVSNYP